MPHSLCTFIEMRSISLSAFKHSNVFIEFEISAVSPNFFNLNLKFRTYFVRTGYACTVECGLEEPGQSN